MKNIIDKEVNINTKEIELLKKGFPSCFDKEGNFNIEKFQSIISTDTNIVKESYKLDWLGKSYSRLLANTPVTTLLTEDIEHNSKPENKNSNNLYIEGDNLEVLKHLTNAYSEKVKMIYIDPPYNTGSDFIYQDDRKFTSEELSKMANIDEEEAKRVLDFTNSKSNSHSAWLTFMYPRLYIARELLKEDGVIFISIDDNEVSQLKLLCDEIFGESNFVGQWNWFKSNTPPNLSKKIKKNIEYIIVYEKNKTNIKYKGIKKESSSNDPITKPQNTMKVLEFPAKCFEISLPDGIYKANTYGTSKFPNKLLNDIVVENGTNINIAKFENKFIWLQEKLNNEINENTKFFLSKQLVISYKKSMYDNEVPPNFISSEIGSTTENAGRKLVELLNFEKTFDYPKSVEILKYLIQFQNLSNSIILDFFSGSSTTAHAVMDLNAEDNGNRKYIMVQLPEVIEPKQSKSAYDFCIENKLEPIIPSIAKERIKRASKKIVEENQDKEYINDLDFGFKVFKTKELENSNYLDELESFDPTREKLFADDVLTIEELYSLALTWKTHDGVPLTTPFNTISLSSYEGLIVENRLYLMYADFTTEALQELLRYNDEEPEFLINQVIVYGLNFSSKHIKEIKEAIMMNNKKSASIELDVRY